MDFTDIVRNGADFDTNSVITALNDGVSVSISELEAGYINGTDSVVNGELYIDYTTADNKNENIKNVNWIGFNVVSADEGLTVADGNIRVTRDGTVTLSDGISTINIVISNYTRLVAEELSASGVDIEVLDGSVPAGSKVMYAEHTEEETQALVSEYNIEATDTVGAFDVSIAMPEGDEFTEPGSFKVSVDVPAVEVPEGAVAVYKLYHIHEGQAEKIEAEVADGKLSFVTNSFSDFVYTVDFEYTDPVTGETIAWKWAGRGSYAIADIMEQLDVTDSITTVELKRTDDQGGSEKALYLEEKVDGWYLTSEEAFMDTFELRVISGGKEYVLKVTDAAQIATTDLSSLLESVTVDGATKSSSGGYVVKPDVPYAIKLLFKEDAFKCFDESSQTLTYTLPAGFTVENIDWTTFPVYAETLGTKYTISGSEFKVEGNVLTIKLNKNDPNYTHMSASTSAEIEINITGEFGYDYNKVNFQAKADGEINIDKTNSVEVKKTASSVNLQTGEVVYTLDVYSTGENNSVSIHDELMSTTGALTYIKNNVTVVDATTNAAKSGYTLTENDKGFDITGLNLANKEHLIITYKCQLDKTKLTQDGEAWGTEADTKNMASWNDGNPHDPKYINLGHVIDAPTLSKGATKVSAIDSDGYVTIDWKIEATSEPSSNGRLSSITDQIRAGSEAMFYADTGINVEITNLTNNTTTSDDKSWAQLGIDPASSKTWTYTVPTVQENDTNRYKYVVTYKTKVKADQITQDTVFNNDTHNDKGKESSGSATVKPKEENKTNITKTAYEVSQQTTKWRVTIKAPTAIDLTPAVFTDIYPTGASYSDGVVRYHDTYVPGSFKIISGWGAEGETYDIVDTDPAQLQVTFKKNGVNILPKGTEIVVELETNNDQDWIEEGAAGTVAPGHTNTAKINENSITATSYPVKSVFNKTHSEGTIAVDGGNVPLYTYSIVTNGLTASYFAGENVASDSNGKYLLLEDTFDANLVFDTSNGGNSYNIVFGGPQTHQSSTWSDYNNHQVVPYEIVDNGDGTKTARIKLYESELPRTDGTVNGPFWEYYKYVYHLYVKDLDTYNKLKEDAAFNEDGSHAVSLGNTVHSTLGDGTDTVTITQPVLEKTATKIEGSKVDFTLTVNSGKLDLDTTKDYIVLTDTLTENLSVRYQDIQMTSSGDKTVTMTVGEQQVTLPYFNMVGNLVTFYLPDETAVTITYRATVSGQANADGKVHFENTAELNVRGESDSEDGYATSSGSGKGASSNPGVYIYKCDNDVNSKTLNGAKFKIYEVEQEDSEGNFLVATPLKAQDGSDYLIVTGAPNPVDGTSQNGIGYALGNASTLGWNLKPEQRYYIQEVEAPTGYAIDDTKYSFYISRDGRVNYTDTRLNESTPAWTFYDGDTLTVKNKPIKGELKLTKHFSGVDASQLTDDQRQKIVFTVTDSSGKVIKTIGFNQFTKDSADNSYSYVIGDLEDGTYTVVETVNDAAFVSKTYAVATNGSDAATTESATIVVDEEHRKGHQVEVTNTYNIPSTFRLYKHAQGEMNIKLANAVFDAYKATDMSSSVGQFTTDVRGRFEITTNTSGFETGVLYVLKETQAPEGYKLSEDEIYFYFLPDGTSSVEPSAVGVPAGKELVQIPYKGIVNQDFENSPETTRLEVEKKWVDDDFGDTAPDGINEVYFHLMRTLSYDKEGQNTLGNPAKYPDTSTNYRIVKQSNGTWAMDETTRTALAALPSVEFVNGEKLYCSYEVVENDVSGFLATYEEEDLTESAKVVGEKVTITNTPEDLPEYVQVNVDKTWVDKRGNDMSGTPDISSKTVTMTVYQTTSDFNTGKVVTNGDVAHAVNFTDMKDIGVSFSTDSGADHGTILTPHVYALEGDTLHITVEAPGANSSNQSNVWFDYTGSGDSGGKQTAESLVEYDYVVPASLTGIVYKSYNADANITVVNTTPNRSWLLTQAQAEGIATKTAVDTLTLNAAGGWMLPARSCL